MIRATDMILASQRTVYDGLPTFANTRSMVHVVEVANVIHNSRVTREQDDNPYYVEHLDYRVSLCTVAQEVRKLRSMIKRGQGYGGSAYGYLSASNQAFARKLACSGCLPFYKAR